MKKNIYIILLLILAIGISIFLLNKEKGTVLPDKNNTNIEEYVSYKSSEYSPEFTYPKSWGEVSTKEGNKECLEEDSYRTGDTLQVFDWEFSFPETKLPNSDSMIRTGVRTYELDPSKLNNCGDDFHIKIARKEVDPRTLSSFMLNTITTKNGMTGTYNMEASRLNTESRMQYTFYIISNSKIYIAQPYMSFIPYFGSPELLEMEGKYSGDMAKYLKEGDTAGNIRKHIEEFKKMAESLRFADE